jgi:hypothetical protein
MKEADLELPFSARVSGGNKFDTRRTIFLDNMRREDADLLVNRLNYQEGVRAKIMEDAKPESQAIDGIFGLEYQSRHCDPFGDVLLKLERKP